MSATSTFTDDEIRIRAYYIWQQEGCQHGFHEQHWYKAIREIDVVGVPVYCKGCTFILYVPRANVEMAAKQREVRLQKLRAELDRLNSRIDAPGFIEKAPENVLDDLLERESSVYKEYSTLWRYVWQNHLQIGSEQNASGDPDHTRTV